MPKCSGVIGYGLSQETDPGIWVDSIIEKKYIGDQVRDNRRIVDKNQINDGFSINNNISIVSNKFMLKNLSVMKYMTFMNSKWKITNVEVKAPRLIITLGDIYHE